MEAAHSVPAAGPDSATTAGEVSHAELANAIRALAMDAVQRANSGHPGMPMGMADVATVLVHRFLRFDPECPDWPDRDRLVLSAGHGSMLLYALLYLCGYPGMDIAQIKRFRQLGSATAGHPERGHAPGIETTTGPLGQGLANAVGMALAERLLAARFGAALVDHYTYAIVGDGCLMEGISHEAISLAGHLRLSRLIVLFDDNRVSIDGPTDLAVSDDQAARFRACGWHVQSIDGHDPEAVAEALAAARASDRPSMIACRTVIGFGAPHVEGTAATHGAPLGEDEVQAARARLGWPHPPFEVPAHIRSAWRASGSRGARARRAWQERLDRTPAAQRAAFDAALAGSLPEGLAGALNELKRSLAAEPKAVATRKASQAALEVINATVPNTIGGSADLTGSNNTRTKGLAAIDAGAYDGRYLFYGVREHAMTAAMNGIALHGGFIPYGGTFLAFTDYARPAIRLAALMRIRVILVATHDSIGLGEDGPTHQPVEHLASLRAMPNLLVLRPADAVETAECWALALARRDGPTVLALTRQSVPAVRTRHSDENLCAGGAYQLAAASAPARVTLLASGSEVALALGARERLEAEGVPTRVVSMPSWELFASRPPEERDAVLGAGGLRVGIEAGVGLGWERWIGPDGLFVGMTGFGASAPYKDLYGHFGLSPEAVVRAVRDRLRKMVV